MPKSQKPQPSEHEAELLADLQRIQAEFINYKRRADEERIRAVQAGKEQAAIALLPILDNIERAIAHEPADIVEHPWVKGVGAVAKQLEGQLETIGLRKIGAVGDLFDPNVHEAVAMDDGDGETEVIAAVLQTGYAFGDTVLRPAMVKVTKQ